jgi:hypothetical protein
MLENSRSSSISSSAIGDPVESEPGSASSSDMISVLLSGAGSEIRECGANGV